MQKAPNDTDYPLRRAIRETLEARGISKLELCRRAKMNPSALYRYLSGKRDLLAKAADRLRIELGLDLSDPVDNEEE